MFQLQKSVYDLKQIKMLPLNSGNRINNLDSSYGKPQRKEKDLQAQLHSNNLNTEASQHVGFFM